MIERFGYHVFSSSTGKNRSTECPRDLFGVMSDKVNGSSRHDPKLSLHFNRLGQVWLAQTRQLASLTGT